jgi:hypothetical protein
MMKISVKLVALHFQLSILTGKFKLQNEVSFLYQFLFTQHCTRLVQRYLQTGDVKKAKPTGRTLTEDVVS